MCVAVVVGCGCANELGDERLDITFDPCAPLVLNPAADTTSAERTAIDDAIEMWNGVVPTAMTRDELPGAARVDIRFEEAAPVFHGIYLDEVGEIVINRNLSDGHERAVTIAHELGHAFGFWHVSPDERVSVMAEGNLAVEPTAGDASALEQLWGACADPMAHQVLSPGSQP